jgi:energy-coupling factor transport system substrate-specific component
MTIVIPLTILAGIFLLDDRSFYVISLFILFFSMLPFVFVFEASRPEAKELVVIAVLCGIAVAGRMAFFMLPQIKPIVAIVIISGLVFGGETGFFVGAMSGFVSNFYFGQGPWTPWQMFCLGIIGFIAGLVFKKGLLPRHTSVICIFGGLATLVIYGGIINIGAMLMWSTDFSWQRLLAFYATGLPFDIAHALATVMFLLILARPMIRILDRIKVKYGMVDG